MNSAKPDRINETKPGRIMHCNRILLMLAAQFIVFAQAVILGADKHNLTLIDLLDSPKIVGVELPALPFTESVFAIQEVLASHVVNVERNGALSLAEKIRVSLSTLREGEQVVTKDPMSIRGYLQDFATKWKVAILLNNDTVMVVELWDKDRFPHLIAILPEKGNGN